MKYRLNHCPSEYSSELYRIRHLKCLSVSNQVSSFFKCFYSTLSSALTKDILKIKILTKVATSRNRPHIHLRHFYFSIKKLFKKRPWCINVMFINQGQRTKSKSQKTKELKSKLNLRGRQEKQKGKQNRSRHQARRSTSPTRNHSSRGNERRGCHRSSDKSCPRRRCICLSILPE